MRRAGGAPILAPAAARPTLTLELAGTGVALASSDPEWLRVVGERYEPFLAEVEPTFVIELIADAGPCDAGPSTSCRAAWSREDGDEAFAVRGPWLAVSADLRRRRGEVRGAPDAAGVELLLRHLAPHLVGDGLVLHAAGLADARGAWACCGPSGSGKSTLAALLPAHALCDELVAIRPVGGELVLEALPFSRARRASAPLRGVCCLRHAAGHERTRLAPGAAARRLATVGPWPTCSPAAMRRCFDALTRLVERCPVYDLGFAPTPDVWETLSGTTHGER